MSIFLVRGIGNNKAVNRLGRRKTGGKKLNFQRAVDEVYSELGLFNVKTLHSSECVAPATGGLKFVCFVFAWRDPGKDLFLTACN